METRTRTRESSVEPGKQLHYVSNGKIVYAPLDWHKKGLQQTASGYGGKLTSPYKTEAFGRLYRVYVMCWSNSGTAYIIRNGVKYILENDDTSNVDRS